MSTRTEGSDRAFAPDITTPKTHDLPARIHLTHEGWVTQRNCLIPGGHSSLHRLIVYDVGNVTSKLRRYVGWRNFGLRRTRLLHLESTFAHVVLDGVLTRTAVLTLTPTQRARLQGARTLGPAPLIDQRPTLAPPGPSAPCPAVAAPKSSANASRSGYVMPVRSSPSKSTRPPCASTTTANTRSSIFPAPAARRVTRHKAYGHITNHKTG